MDIKIKNIEIKEKFVEYSISHGNAILLGDSKKANKFHKKLHQLYDWIKNEDNIFLLRELINYPDDKVRIWVAGFLLPYEEKQAKEVLKEIVKREDILSVSASLTLEMWDANKIF